ncbi:MAG: hypothetical protein EPN21_16435 [Methylococcaceae bacterium]|nr:MAG: hypothetical protein EPN21_16435 [Methylococcaceae bacterium]
MNRSYKHFFRTRVREFTIPLISDGLVLGRQAPIGGVAFSKALELLIVSPFERIGLEDEVISDILIRQSLLRRVPRERLVEFVLQRVKPLMGPEEILHLELTAEILIEEESS